MAKGNIGPRRYWVHVVETVHYSVPVQAFTVTQAEGKAESKVVRSADRDKWCFAVTQREAVNVQGKQDAILRAHYGHD